jgi:hypothetical protein
MKVKDLLKHIECFKTYCSENELNFLEFDVYTEQLDEKQKSYKKKPSRSDFPWYDKKNGQGWPWFKWKPKDCNKKSCNKCNERIMECGWEYFQAYNSGVDLKRKIFLIDIDF